MSYYIDFPLHSVPKSRACQIHNVDFNASVRLSRSAKFLYVPASRLTVGDTAAFVRYTQFDQVYTAVIVKLFLGLRKLSVTTTKSQVAVSRSYPLSMNEPNIANSKGRWDLDEDPQELRLKQGAC